MLNTLPDELGVFAERYRADRGLGVLSLALTDERTANLCNLVSRLYLEQFSFDTPVGIVADIYILPTSGEAASDSLTWPPESPA